MCIVGLDQGNPKNLVKSAYFGVNLVILHEIGKEDPKILGYSTSLINFLASLVHFK